MPNDFLSAPDWNAPEPKTIGLQLTCCDRPHGIYMHNRVNGKLMYLTSGRQPAWP